MFPKNIPLIFGLAVIKLLFISTPGFGTACPKLLERKGTVRIFYEEFFTPQRGSELKSVVAAVQGRVQRALDSFIKERGIAIPSIPRRDWIAGWNSINFIRYLTREATENACIWGNKYNPDKRITLTLDAHSHGLFLGVTDQGERPFEPANDPFSMRDHEEQTAFMKRRVAAGKNEGIGLFWADAKDAVQYAYEFRGGSHLLFYVPWIFTNDP